jgi:Domain of unknown function (DUF927)
MQTKEFLQQVWPETGHYCVLGKDQQNVVVPKFINTIDEAVTAVNRLLEDQQDVYFACSTYIEPTERKKINAKEQRILWLDIDCGFDTKKRKWKDYETKDDALKALRKFTDDTQLPEPTIVDSGRGVHCYWPFTEPVDKAIWQPVAEGLKFLCAKHSLKADGACTADMARILRVPGTRNYKDINKPEDVVVINEGKATPFDELASLIPIHVSDKPKAKRPLDEATKAILGNNSSKFMKIIERCRKDDGCGQLIHIMTKQSTVEEPLWRSGLSIAAYCEDSEAAIHNISKHHPDYEYARTEAKASGIPGPHTCKQFEGLRPEGCDGCKHKGKITSPIELGRVILRSKGADNVVKAKSEELGQEVTYHIPDYPFPYFRGKNGGIYKTVAEEDEEAIMVYDYDFYLVEILHDQAAGFCAWFKMHLPFDGVQEFIAPVTQLLSRDEARKVLNATGIFRNGKKLDYVIDYIIAVLEAHQKQKKATTMYKQYGWNATFNKIIIGNREISAFGIKYVPVSEALKDVNPALQKKGTYEEWKKAISVYERKGMELRAFGFFCAFGSLLMPFFKTREKSAVINLYNPSTGQGKSTVLQAMTSVYGNPEMNANLIQLWGDTGNAVINRMGYMNNLPAAVDEFTKVTPDQLHDFLKFMSTGRGKNRLGSNGTNRERQNDTIFNLICVVSSNTDFRTVIFSKNAQASGEMARFLQIRIEKDHTLSKTEADEYFGRLFDNYGHAGEIYAQWIISNLDIVKASLLETQKSIDKAWNITGEDRKYSATLAAVFLGAQIAKQLGIHNIDLEPVKQAIKIELEKSRIEIKARDFDAMETLTAFLHENLKNTLVINSKSDSRTGLQEAPLLKPINELRVRIEPDTNTIYIPCGIMRSHLEENGNVSYDDFVNKLRDNSVLRRRSGDSKIMHKGLEISGSGQRCLWIDNSSFEEIMTNNLPLDIPRNVN